MVPSRLTPINKSADVVGGGEVEDGIGDVGADDVHGNHGDIVLGALFGGGEENAAGFVVFVERGAGGGGAELDVDLADEEDEEDAVDLLGVAGGEVEESLAAAGGDHDVGARHVELVGGGAECGEYGVGLCGGECDGFFAAGFGASGRGARSW